MATPNQGIGVRTHPPERRRSAPVTLNAGCCCCCCCCCLHTVGGLIGAAMGSSAGAPAPRPRWYEDTSLPAAPVPHAPRHSTGIKTGAGEVTTGPTHPEPIRPDYDEDVFDVRQPSRLSAAALFWYLSLAAGGLGLLFSVLGGATPGQGGGLLVGIVILAMVFPAVQLVAAVIVFFVFLLSTRYDRGAQLSQIGKITGGLMVGTFIGFGMMILMCAGCR
jgi:hypothetical protein